MPIIIDATPAHGPGLTAIAEAVRYKAGEASGNDGYLITVRSPEEYAQRILRSGCSVVAVEGDLVVGFLIAVPGPLLDELSSKDVTRPFAQAKGDLERYVLMDQIGILPTFKGTGLGSAMLRAVLERTQPNRWGASIMHDPVRNHRSLGLFTGKMGLALQGTASDGTYTFGYYERSEA